MDNYLPFDVSAAPATFNDRVNDLVAVLPNHPLLYGVRRFRVTSPTLFRYTIRQNRDANATLIANGSDSFALAAVKGKAIGLNFSPVSSPTNPNGWDSTTDGAQLLANALLITATNRPRVALLHSETDATLSSDVQSKLEQTLLFERVDLIDCANTQPSFAQLQVLFFQIIIVFVYFSSDKSSRIIRQF